MNTIVREHYPVGRLPDDLRPDDSTAIEVRVTVEPADDCNGDPLPLTRLLEEMQDQRVLSDDPVTRVRASRAEWERREELHDRIRAGEVD